MNDLKRGTWVTAKVRGRMVGRPFRTPYGSIARISVYGVKPAFWAVVPEQCIEAAPLDKDTLNVAEQVVLDHWMRCTGMSPSCIESIFDDLREGREHKPQEAP